MMPHEKPSTSTPAKPGVSSSTTGAASSGNGLECGGADPFTKDQFAAMWDDWTEASYRLVDDPTSFLEQCEDAGLAECVPVDEDALDDPMAAERGIEPGGMMWRLTPEGHARYHLRTLTNGGPRHD